MFPLNLCLQELFLGVRNSLYMCFTSGTFQVSQTSSACLRTLVTNMSETGKIPSPRTNWHISRDFTLENAFPFKGTTDKLLFGGSKGQKLSSSVGRLMIGRE